MRRNTRKFRNAAARRAIRNIQARREGTLALPSPAYVSRASHEKQMAAKDRGGARVGEKGDGIGGARERTGTRKRRERKTSAASSLDPHLNPPPRQLGEEAGGLVKTEQ